MSHYVAKAGLPLARTLLSASQELPSQVCPSDIFTTRVFPDQMFLFTRYAEMASKRITQETFDAAVRENIEEFEMGAEEAVREAVEQFESQGRLSTGS